MKTLQTLILAAIAIFLGLNIIILNNFEHDFSQLNETAQNILNDDVQIQCQKPFLSDPSISDCDYSLIQ